MSCRVRLPVQVPIGERYLEVDPSYIIRGLSGILATLSQKRPEQGVSSSFRLYDIWNCIFTKSSLSFELS
jgi:hypothetical protein